MTLPENADGNRPAFRSLIKPVVFLASLIAIGVAVKWSGLDEALDRNWVDAHIRGQGIAGLAFFMGATAFLTGIGMPRQLLAFLGGYAFGALGGTALALVGTTLGCAAGLFYARFFARKAIRSRWPGKVQAVDRFLRHNPFSMAMIIRFMPVGSNMLTNLAAGVSSAHAGTFILGSAVGYLPQTFIFALLGSGFAVETGWRVGISVVLFALSLWWGWLLYRRYRSERAAAEK